MKETRLKIHVGHSPDADDAFMFYALARGKINTGPYLFRHELVDIETLNRRAFRGELELTALSLHAYAHLTDRYVLCTCGASMGDRYGPMLVARTKKPLEAYRQATIAVPGMLTTAYLALRMCLGMEFREVVVPFERILDVVVAGEYEGQPIDAGLIIHEGQLTYAQQGLALIVDTGQWWFDQTGLPLPLGANGLRKDLGQQVIADVPAIAAREHRVWLAASSRCPGICGSVSAADWIRPRLTNSLPCTSTIGRWILVRAAARPSPSCLPADMRPA